MKKIRSIKQLRIKKQQLNSRKSELEKAIRYDWKDVKESLKPVHIAEQLLSKQDNGNDHIHSRFTDGVAQTASVFIKKLTEKAAMNIAKWLKK